MIKILFTIILFLLVNIVIWYQLNSQLVWEWAKGTKSMWFMSLMGIPISYVLLLTTKYGFQGFGELWPIRLMGFATGMISFPFITYWILGEGITLKTGVSILLSVVIMLLQLI